MRNKESQQGSFPEIGHKTMKRLGICSVVFLVMIACKHTTWLFKDHKITYASKWQSTMTA